MSKRAFGRDGSRSSNPPPTLSGCQSARLIGVGFRLWFKGKRTGDVEHWENAWRLYVHCLGSKAGMVAVRDLSCWVDALSDAAVREIEVAPDTCPGFCRDECLAIAMIAACQHKTCPAIRACAFALVENSHIEHVIDRSEHFAMTMLAVDQILSPNFIVNAAALSVRPDTAVVH